MKDKKAVTAIIEAPVEVQTVEAPFNPLDNPDFTGLVIDRRKVVKLSKVQSIKLALDVARKEELEERRTAHWVAIELRSLDKLCVNPLIGTYQQALEVAKADLVAVQLVLQDALANVAFLQSELAKLTGQKAPKGNTTIARTTSRNKEDADRFGLVGNESAFMQSIASIGPCTMAEALRDCGQIHPQYRLVERMILAGFLVKTGKTLSLA